MVPVEEEKGVEARPLLNSQADLQMNWRCERERVKSEMIQRLGEPLAQMRL